MIVVEDRCCDCAVPGYPCRGNSCRLRHYPAIYCDVCGCEISEDENHEFDGQDLCQDCYDEIPEEEK